MALPAEPTRALPAVLSGGRRGQLQRLPAAVSRPDQVLVRLVDDLDRTQAGKGLSGLVAGLSRSLAGALGLEEDTISEFLAAQTGLTEAEVHIALGAPLLGVPGMAGPIVRLLREDIAKVAASGDPETVAALGRQALDIFTTGAPFQLGKTIAQAPLKRIQKTFLKEVSQLAESARKVRDRILRR